MSMSPAWFLLIGLPIGGLLSWLAFQSQINEYEAKLESVKRQKS